MTTIHKVLETTTATMLLALIASSPAYADALHLTSPTSGPDLAVFDPAIGYTYDAGTNTGTFTASGDYGLLCLKDSPCLNTNAPYRYNLLAQLTGSGSLLSGSFGITDATSSPVLSARLNAFGSSGASTGSGVFEFTTDQASGWLTSDYPALQSDLGIIMSTASGINFQDFTHDFSTVADAPVTVDHFAVPVPAATWLFGSGLIGLVAVARRGRGATDGNLKHNTKND